MHKMGVRLLQIALPESFVNNVLALRGVAKCVKRSNKGGWQSDRCDRKTYSWASSVIDDVQAAAGVTSDITYWYNINSGSDYNEWHHHDRGGADEMCGVLYLQVPENAGCFEYKIKTEMFQIKPYSGLLILFPDDLMHRVLPNDGDGERISMAFNFWKMLK
jgi:hypothetical protein